MNESNKAEIRDRLGNIDQIRDILFGSQLRDYNNRIEHVEKAISILQKELRDRTDEVKQVISTEFQATVESLDKNVKSLSLKHGQEKLELEQQIDGINKKLSSAIDSLKKAIFSEIQTTSESIDNKLKSWETKDNQEKIEIRQQIDLLNKRLANSFESLDQSIDHQTSALRADLLSSREKLQEDLIGLRSQIFKELERNISNLQTSKVSGDDLAEILFELGLRLKGSEFIPTLNQAADNKSSETVDSFLLPNNSEA